MKDIYEKFKPLENAKMAFNIITTMVDEKCDNLPYWLIIPHKKPAEASHCRVDDAELVGSWYEGLDSLQEMLQTDEGSGVKASFKRHLMKSWGEHGLRFHEDYPWSNTNHSSFHEMGYILPALNRIVEKDADSEEAEMRAANLVRGMRSLVIERKVRTFWSGDSEVPERIYEFPNDVYLRDGGFDMTRFTGRGETSIRNAIMLHSLVRRYEIADDEIALDLAVGMANYLLTTSRYFNYKMEFFGHVHSSGWVASGLVRLGRVTGDKRYIEKGKAIIDYIISISSSFGWVPEYAQWHPMEEEHCETCCIKDVIECSSELIDAGYDEYWNIMNIFARNQLIENQFKSATYVVVDNSKEDTETTTYREMDKRIIGGFTGGGMPNSLSLTKFRNIAGCCVGMAPVALNIVWQRAVEYKDGMAVVNIPLDKETDDVKVTSGYPNSASIVIAAKHDLDAAVRVYPWMDEVLGMLNGKKMNIVLSGGLAIIKNMKSGDVAEFTHLMETVSRKETAAGAEYEVIWRGPDVVDMLPRGEHFRLYQRRKDVRKYLPTPEDAVYRGPRDYGPTQQKGWKKGKK